MFKHAFAILFVAAGLTGCTTDEKQDPREVAFAALAGPVETRPLVDQVVRVTVEPTFGGAILSATGVVPSPGYHDAELVSSGAAENGAWGFDFHVSAPAQPIGAQQTEIVVARFLRDKDLANVNRITVFAAENVRAVQR